MFLRCCCHRHLKVKGAGKMGSDWIWFQLLWPVIWEDGTLGQLGIQQPSSQGDAYGVSNARNKRAGGGYVFSSVPRAQTICFANFFWTHWIACLQCLISLSILYNHGTWGSLAKPTRLFPCLWAWLYLTSLLTFKWNLQKAIQKDCELI